MTRDEAIKIITYLPINIGRQNGKHLIQEAMDMAIESLKRKRGEWIVLYDEDSPQDGVWKCSMCDYIRLVDDITPTNYCPNCGADMRGEEDEIQ